MAPEVALVAPPPPPPPSDAQKPKRARTSKPKVKTGCNNCKQRRIKCDEKRPSCSNCSKSKKTCGGYPPPPRRPGAFQELRIAPKPTMAPLAPGGGPQPLAAAAGGPGPGPAVAPGRASLVAARPQSQQLPPRRAQKLNQRNKAAAAAAAAATTPPPTPVAPQSSSTTAVVALYHNPSPRLAFGPAEGQYFQLFQTRTASELSGFFDNIFWSRTVLQECHEAAAIRHAVVALGALYKTLDTSSESPPGSPTPASDRALVLTNNAVRHWEVALKEYSNACIALGTLDGKDQRCQRSRLMASVLLACFDSFIGDHQQAIIQIQTGLALLEEVRAERRRAFVARPEEPVEDELIQMFTRLAIQAKSYDMAFHFPHPYVIRLLPINNDPSSPGSDPGSPVSTHHQEPIPESFDSLRDARLAWDTLCEKIFRFTEFMFKYMSTHATMILPAETREYGAEFKFKFEAWSRAFQPLLDSRTVPGVTSQEKAGRAVLKMFQIMGQILYLMTFSDTEMQFDAFQMQFKAIVDLAQEVVGDEERRAAEKRCPDRTYCQHQHKHQHNRQGHQGYDAGDMGGGHEYAALHIKPSFSADLGIVPPLYVVATKCRDRLIRRQAIELLRSSARREGMWDSELAARIGMWVMEIEEKEDEDVEEIIEEDQHMHQAPVGLGLLSPQSPPLDASSRPRGGSPAGGSSITAGRSPSIDFGEIPLGPGGNARWDERRASTVSALSGSSKGYRGQNGQNGVQPGTVPAEKRVLIKSCEFDLREHTATLQCGTRGVQPGMPDSRLRITRIRW